MDAPPSLAAAQGVPLTSPLRAVLRLGGSSALGIIAAVALGKVQALVLGPAGVARYSLLLTVVNLTMIPASLGMSQALTRLGGIDAPEDGAVFARARRAAAFVRGVAGGVCLLVMSLLVGPICAHVLGGQVTEWELALTLVAIAGSLVVGHDIAILATAQRINVLARFTMSDALGGAAAAAALTVMLGRNGVAPSILAGVLVATALSRRAVRTDIRRSPYSPSPHTASAAPGVAGLLRVGAPYTVASAVGSAVTFSIPILALHLLSATAVGYYQVSQMVATGYLGFLSVAMAQDYFPRLSGASASALDGMINQQQRLVLLLSLPLILATVCAAPLILRIAFSHQFAAADGVLRWQVLADTLRFSSWALAYAILARLRMRLYIAVEAFGGIALFTATVVCVHLWGTPGLGIAPVVSYTLYYAVVALIVRRNLGFRYSAENRRLFSLAILTVAGTAAIMATGLSVGGEALVALVALAWTAWSVRELLPEVRGRSQRGTAKEATAIPAS